LRIAPFSDGRGVCFYSERTDGDVRAQFLGSKVRSNSDLMKKIYSVIIRKDVVVVKASQCHSSAVAPVSTRWELVPEVDALVSKDPAILPSVMVADCVPIALYAPKEGVFAAVHAGWRGLVKGVISNAVDTMRSDYHATDLEAVVGPHICARCYEFVGESSETVRSVLGADCFTKDGGSHLDLFACVEKILDTKAVEMIFEEKDCTLCSGDFFSYRGGDTTERIILGVGVVGE